MEVLGGWGRGGVWGRQGGEVLSRAARTGEAPRFVTCADLALCDVQEEGVGIGAEVTGALNQGRRGGTKESSDTRALLEPVPSGPAPQTALLRPPWARVPVPS